MPFFRKKPKVIEAVQWTGDPSDGCWDAIAAMHRGDHFYSERQPDGTLHLLVSTLEGTMRALPGDWIIKGVHGEVYPIKPDIFAETYDPAEAP